MPTTRNMIASSCSVGMNSLPRNGNSASAPISSAQRGADDDLLALQRPVEQRQVQRLAPRTSQVSFSSLGFRSGTQHRHQRQRQQQRAGHREGDGQRHRFEQLASSPVSENSGRKTTMMIRMAKAIGFSPRAPLPAPPRVG